MELRLIAVGRPSRDPFDEAVVAYAQRCQVPFRLSLVSVAEGPSGRGVPVEETQARERARILAQVPSGAALVLWDERGTLHSSKALAQTLTEWLDSARPPPCFAIGGASGLHPELRKEARAVWSLSPMTLPHRVARLVVAEQLYRAQTIMTGRPYHK